jgi:hypothetical protein
MLMADVEQAEKIAKYLHSKREDSPQDPKSNGNGLHCCAKEYSHGKQKYYTFWCYFL